jgi:outer membrane protein TolC
VNPPATEPTEASVKKIKELQKERLATLQDYVDVVTKLVRSGRESCEEALEARRLLLQAELNATENKDDRIALYRKAIETLKQYEELANDQIKAGGVTSATVLKIQAGRLELEAAMLQATLATAQNTVNPPATEPTEASVKKIKELQKERLATLEKLVDQAASQFQKAKASYEDVLEAQLLLLKGRLDLAEKGADRIAIYAQAIEVLKKFEEVANARFQAGRATAAAGLKIKARRLEVEIQLEQAKAREAKARK